MPRGVRWFDRSRGRAQRPNANPNTTRPSFVGASSVRSCSLPPSAPDARNNSWDTRIIPPGLLPSDAALRHEVAVEIRLGQQRSQAPATTAELIHDAHPGHVVVKTLRPEHIQAERVQQDVERETRPVRGARVVLTADLCFAEAPEDTLQPLPVQQTDVHLPFVALVVAEKLPLCLHASVCGP